MIYITGDTHGSFQRIAKFCDRMQTTTDDIIIILGDSGINYGGGQRDESKKAFLNSLPVTIFSIHGNHEQRPFSISTYHTSLWNNGNVYVEDEYPNILFGVDGEIYNLGGAKTLVIGGAYSIDWMYRIPGRSWWMDEQPSEAIKARVAHVLASCDWKVDVVLTHTIPLKYEPTEAFLPSVDQCSVDKSTETWLDYIEEKLSYKRWYCGHYHIDKKIDKMHILFEQMLLFNTP